jgi:hypothetical protein
MNRASQVTQPRLWISGGTEAFRIVERIAKVAPRRGHPAHARRRLQARSAHGARRAVVAALALLAGAGALTSALTYRAGLAWRDRAGVEIDRTHGLAMRVADAEARAANAAGELSRARAELRAMAAQLQRSEADVVQLERRLQALGTEKARVEDEREAARSDRDRLAEVAGFAARVGQDVDTCVNSLASWLARKPSYLNVTQHAFAAWASSGDSVMAACANARLSNGRLKVAANG